MGFWTNKTHRTIFDDAEDLGTTPPGGPLKMWLVGVGVALVPIVYGITGLVTGTIMMPARYRNLPVHGTTAMALSIAYISVGVFIHFHWFWGINERLWRWSLAGKIVAVLVFLGSFGVTCWHLVK